MISQETNWWKRDMSARMYSVGICENNTLSDSNKNVKNM